MTREEELYKLANTLAGKLKEFYVHAVKEYVDHGETTLALEMLCDFLGDSDVVLSEFEYQEIERLGNLLGLDVDDVRFTYLKNRRI